MVGQATSCLSQVVPCGHCAFITGIQPWQCRDLVEFYTALPHIFGMQTVAETPDYVADAKAAGMSMDEREAVIDHIAANPQAGDLIVGTGGARKLRWRRPGTGKSGGYRIITYYGGDDIPVFLLNVFTKTTQANLTGAERNTLRAILADIARAYREGA